MEELLTAVSVENLTKRFSKDGEIPPALSNINFKIPIGKIWCLLGPNGSGKTTLLKILAGLLSPNEGQATIMDVNITDKPEEARSKIGWMPAEERSGFYGRLTGRQNLNFFGVLQGMKPVDVDPIIGNLSFLLDLNDEIDRMMLKISAGVRQRLAFARSIIHNPAVLLLDEPMRNLDPQAVLRFRRFIKDHLVRKDKKTILLSTHQLEEARRIADHYLILRKGKIVRSMSAEELEAELKGKSIEDFYMKILEAEDRK